jgi:hypothetical protein
MKMRIGMSIAAVTVVCAASLSAKAQSSGFNFGVHANDKVTAADVGLPAYPGATVYKEKPDDSSSADLGFTWGDTHFRVMVASYETSDAADRVLAFYRKPLSKYGQVLECSHGKPVGALKVTDTGLTCDDDKKDSDDKGHDGIQMNGVNSSDDHELRAGSPHKFRLVGIDEKKSGEKTRFGLVYLELPKDSN